MINKFDKRILGLDIGEKRIGVAVSSLVGNLAQPVEVVERTSDEDAINKLKKIIQVLQPVKMIAGIPLGLKGEAGKSSKKILDFLNKLKEETNLPIDTIDERFSTKEVDKLMISSGVRRNKRKEKKDILAAVLILQSYLDRNS